MSMTMMILSIIVGLADVYMDWQLYNSLYVTQRGLLFGPLSQSLIQSQSNMLWIGVGALALKIIRILVYLMPKSKNFRNNIFEGITALPILIVYQAPKTWIQGDIARCHANAVNEVLAMITIASFFIKLAVLAWHVIKACGMNFCQCFEEIPESEKRCVLIMQIFRVLTLAFILVLLANTFTDVYCYKQTYEECLVPGKFYDALTDSDLIRRYFHRVGVFIRLENTLWDSNSYDECGWIKLLSFTEDIFQRSSSLKAISSKDFVYDIVYEKHLFENSSINLLRISKNNENEVCFNVREETCDVSSCTHNDSILLTETYQKIRFLYTKPSIPERVFGDLTFNWIQHSQNINGTSVAGVPVIKPNIYYMKEVRNSTSEVNYLLRMPYNDDIRFYRKGKHSVFSNRTDITDTIQGWYFHCNTDDIQIPRLNKNIVLYGI